jgi:hypothetical protein
MRFEHRHQRPLPLRRYLGRLLLHGCYAAVALGGSLAIGVAGYHWLGGFDWIDSILNASMILGGMGPVGELTTPAVKLFASAYALYSGVLFIALAGLLIAPVFHRVLHLFHAEADQSEDDAMAPPPRPAVPSRRRT